MWIGAGVGDTVISAATKSLISTLSAGALLLRPFTILRTRMLIYWVSDQQTGTEQSFGTYARLVVTDTAAALGVTAIPDLSVLAGDPEASWHVVQTVAQRFVFGTAVAFQAQAGWQYTVDSKAMRKVGPDDNVVAMFSEDGTSGGRLITQGRQLIQLH